MAAEAAGRRGRCRCVARTRGRVHDKGSTLRAWHPAAHRRHDEVLANLMLPEGAHHREEDTTHFFLYRGPEAQHGKRAARSCRPAVAWLRICPTFSSGPLFRHQPQRLRQAHADLPQQGDLSPESSSTMSHFRIIRPTATNCCRLRIHYPCSTRASRTASVYEKARPSDLLRVPSTCADLSLLSSRAAARPQGGGKRRRRSRRFKWSRRQR